VAWFLLQGLKSTVAALRQELNVAITARDTHEVAAKAAQDALQAERKVALSLLTDMRSRVNSAELVSSTLQHRVSNP